jgi:hypothetical protein
MIEDGAIFEEETATAGLRDCSGKPGKYQRLADQETPCSL